MIESYKGKYFDCVKWDKDVIVVKGGKNKWMYGLCLW